MADFGQKEILGPDNTTEDAKDYVPDRPHYQNPTRNPPDSVNEIDLSASHLYILPLRYEG